MRQLLALTLTLLFTLYANLTFAAPKSELWPFWDKSNEQNQQSISHQSWQIFLDRYLKESGEHTLLAYRLVTDTDKSGLKSYINKLATLDPRDYPKGEQYAYWVNLYNALTVDLILDKYPIKSITKLGGIFSFGPWGDNVITVAGESLTLNDIEHRILRPIWNDARTHYAVNCASLGCPNLQKQVFTANNYQALLDKAAKQFINSDKGVLIDNGKAQLSSIYDWFASDFGNQNELLKHLAQFRQDLPTNLGKTSFDYNWSLNDAK